MKKYIFKGSYTSNVATFWKFLTPPPFIATFTK